MQRFMQRGFSSKSTEKRSKKGRKSEKKLHALGALVPSVPLSKISTDDDKNKSNDVKSEREIVDNQLYESVVFQNSENTSQKGKYVSLMTQIYDEVAPDQFYDSQNTVKPDYLSSRDQNGGNYSHLNILRGNETMPGYDALQRESGLVNEAIYDHADDVILKNSGNNRIPDVPDYETITLSRTQSAYDDVALPSDTTNEFSNESKVRAFTYGAPGDNTPFQIPRGSMAPRVRPTIRKKQLQKTEAKEYSRNDRISQIATQSPPMHEVESAVRKFEIGNNEGEKSSKTSISLASKIASIESRSSQFSSGPSSPNQSPRTLRPGSQFPKFKIHSLPSSPNISENRKSPYNARKPTNMKLSPVPSQSPEGSELINSPLFKTMQKRLESYS
uniref:uncharacterized protein LOC120331074 n=1 Tax=Styela clava TaxID=7725 RepID=UPI00193A4374|nr:uncharacterized protein LOC120331074 [Styela clava]